MVVYTALRTGRRRRPTDAASVSFKTVAVTRAELGKKSLVAARQSGLRAGDWRRAGVENVVDVAAVSTSNVGSMNANFSNRIDARGNNTVNKIRLNVAMVRVLEEVLLVPWALRASDRFVRRMVRAEGTSQKLPREHLYMISYRKHRGLMMEMILRGHPVSTGGMPKRCILNTLKTLHWSSFDVGCPDGGGKVDLGTDVQLVGFSG